MALSLRLPRDLESRLEALAERTGRTKTWYVREAIAEYLADLEDAAEAAIVAEQVSLGKMQAHSLEEAERRLGLAD
jgi:RHH-type rel operon transcriptional repressor/antitoxin RelB